MLFNKKIEALTVLAGFIISPTKRENMFGDNGFSSEAELSLYVPGSVRETTKYIGTYKWGYTASKGYSALCYAS